MRISHQSTRASALLVCFALAVAVAGCDGATGTSKLTGNGALPNTPVAEGSNADELASGSDDAAPKPSAAQDLYENLSASGEHTTFWRLVNRAKLDKELAGAGPLTVFAPNEEAFRRLPRPVYARLWVNINRQRVHYLVGYQILRGRYDAEDLKRIALRGDRIRTLEGEKISPTYSNGKLAIEDAFGRSIPIVSADQPASNGLMHVVGRLSVPGVYLK